MGAWGHKSFENDSALDWLCDLGDAEPSLVSETLDAVGDAAEDAYVDVDEACAALAAAELVAAALGKGDDRLNKDAASWLKDSRAVVETVGAARARRAVERLFKSSELRKLWDENGANTEWHADVRELLERLT